MLLDLPLTVPFPKPFFNQYSVTILWVSTLPRHRRGYNYSEGCKSESNTVSAFKEFSQVAITFDPSFLLYFYHLLLNTTIFHPLCVLYVVIPKHPHWHWHRTGNFTNLLPKLHPISFFIQSQNALSKSYTWLCHTYTQTYLIASQ